MATETHIAEINRLFTESYPTPSISRQKALEAFQAKGLPGQRDEEYRFTPIVRFATNLEWKKNYATRAIPQLDNSEVNRVVLVNGIWNRELSSLNDKEVTVITSATSEAFSSDPFELLNAAFHPMELMINVAAGAQLKHPIHIIDITTADEPVAVWPRWSLELNENSSAQVLVSSAGIAGLIQRSQHIRVAHHASLEMLILQNQPEEKSVNNLTIELAESSRSACLTITTNGKLIRNNTTMNMSGRLIESHLHGAYLVAGDSHVDNHTVVDHKEPDSLSNELYKGIVAGKARAVFNGKIYVRQNAQKTNAYQTNRNILIGDQAVVNTKPQLEIWADDVKCSHGCTTGQLDDEAMFYLRSRGVDETTARALLLEAFASEVLSDLSHEWLIEQARTAILNQLSVLSKA